MLWKLAARSVLARRSRSLFLMLSLALSSLVVVVGASLMASIRSNIEDGLKRGFAGDMQVFHVANPRPQFTAEVPIDFVPIEDAGRAMETLLDDPDVLGVTPRSNAAGLVIFEDYSAPAVLVGIDAALEAETLARLRPHDEGAFGKPGTILLGRPMAERLRRLDGGEVTVLIPTADGLFDGDVFEVAGIYMPPGLPLIDEFVAFVPLDHLQMLLGDEGIPGSLVVRLRDDADLPAVRERLRQALYRAELPLEVWTWEEMAGDLLGIVRIGRYLIGSGFLFVLLVVAIGVGNMLLILMLEKAREIGLMRALGTPRWRIVGTLLVEVTLVSALSSAAGALAGGVLCVVLGQVGIPAASRAMAYAFGGERLFLEVHSLELLLGFLVVASVGPFAALWPAARASATDPAEVMRNPA